MTCRPLWRILTSLVILHDSCMQTHHQPQVTWRSSHPEDNDNLASCHATLHVKEGIPCFLFVIDVLSATAVVAHEGDTFMCTLSRSK